MEETEILLTKGLLYRAEALMAAVIAAKWRWRVQQGQELLISFNGQPLHYNVVLNALQEAGAIHLRYLAEFFGLTVSPNGERKEKSGSGDDLRVNCLFTASTPTSLITWKMASEDVNLGEKFCHSLQSCLVATNKLLAHPTTRLIRDSVILEPQDFKQAATGILQLLAAVVYEPRGRMQELLNKCPGLEVLEK